MEAKSRSRAKKCSHNQGTRCPIVATLMDYLALYGEHGENPWFLVGEFRDSSHL